MGTFGHRDVGCGREVVRKVGVSEGEVPTGARGSRREGCRYGVGGANAREASGGEENMKTAVVVRGRGKIKTASAMLGPRLAEEGRVEGDDKLAGRVDGMGGKVVGSTMETIVGGERGVEGPGS